MILPSWHRDPSVRSRIMLRRSSTLLRRACSQLVAGGSSAQAAWPVACESLCASSQLSGSVASATHSWPTCGSVAASAWSRAYSSETQLASGDHSFAAGAASTSRSDPPDVDEPGVLDADAVSSAAALAETDALLQATEAAWYPTVGVQKLVELFHEHSTLPWCDSASHRLASVARCVRHIAVVIMYCAGFHLRHAPPAVQVGLHSGSHFSRPYSHLSSHGGPDEEHSAHGGALACRMQPTPCRRSPSFGKLSLF